MELLLILGFKKIKTGYVTNLNLPIHIGIDIHRYTYRNIHILSFYFRTSL